MPHRADDTTKPADTGVRTPFLDEPGRGLEHCGDRRLVVGSEDRCRRVANDVVVCDDRFDRPFRRDRVEVGAEEDRRPGGAVGRRDPAEDVAHGGVDPCSGVVLVVVEAERLQVVEDAVRDRALLPRRARQRRQLEKQGEHIRCPTGSHAAILKTAAPAKKRTMICWLS